MSKHRNRDTEQNDPCLSGDGDAELVHLLAEVEVDAGHPAYARLTRRYWKAGDLERALEVAAAGFASNPTYEAGALIYLELLASEGTLESAADVFGQAAAELPQSGRLRLLWAEILAKAGRKDEALRRTREAVELSPQSNEARSLLAKLGGSAPAMDRRSRPMSDPTGQSFVHGESAPNAPYTRSIMELLNEPKFTPLKSGGASHPMDYILADGPDDEATAASAEQPNDRSGRQNHVRNAESTEPRSESTEPHAEARELLPDRTDHAEDDRQRLERIERVEQRADRRPSENTRSRRARQRLATGPHWPANRSLPHNESRRRDSESSEWDGGEDQAAQQSEAKRPQIDPNATLAHAVEIYAKQNQRRRRIIGAVILLLGGAIAGASWFFIQHQQQEVQGDVLQEMAKLQKDRYADYLHVSDALSALLSQNPNDRAAHAAAALVNAHIWSRFSRDRNALHDAHSHLKRAQESLPDAQIATALLALGAGDLPTTDSQLELVPKHARNWHFTVAKSWLFTAMERPSEAATLLKDAASKTSSAAVMFLQARTKRLHGDSAAATAAVEKGLKLSPNHPGLLLEKAALNFTQDIAGREANLAKLEKQVANVNIYRSTLALLRARIAISRAEWTLARKLSDISLKAAPLNFEARLLACEVQLFPGGSVTAALQSLDQLRNLLSNFRPGYQLLTVRAMLLAGHPAQAKRLLSTLTKQGLAPEERKTIGTLRIQSAVRLNDSGTVDKLCSSPKLSPKEAIACIEARYAFGKGEEAAGLVERLKAPVAQKRYLRALGFAFQGKLGGAADLLRHWRINDLPDREAPLYHLAKIYAERGSYMLAVESYRELKRREAGSARSSLGMAVSLAAAGRNAQARSELASFLTNKPTDAQLLLESGRLLLSLDETDLAQSILDAPRIGKKENRPLQLLRGELALRQSRWQSAEQAFQWVLDQSPQSVPALLGRARADHKLGRLKEANEYLARAASAAGTDGRRLMEVALALAEAAMFKRAIKLGTQALKLMRGADSPHEAAKYEALLSVKLLVAPRAVALPAMRMLEHAIASTYAPAVAYLELARAYRSQGKIEKAASTFREALIRDNELVIAHYELGLTLSKDTERRDEALSALSLYLKLRPRGKWAKRAHGLLAALRSTSQAKDGATKQKKRPVK